ncbi:MAG: crotonase/enoyl-CoA hydratase family protein [Cytophagaceae bacterium]|nr:crotonase/enoyl-CoA hydratase family protein [Cytophagaceae bacterium]
MELTNWIFLQEGPVAHLILNRPDKANALDIQTWQDLKTAMNHCADTPGIRVIVLSSAGERVFSAGIDLSVLMSVRQPRVLGADDCEGRMREQIRQFILEYQGIISLLETGPKPVLTAIHGGCIGAGLDLVCAADIRYCSADAYFCIKEIDMGMVADFGTLQRLPRLISDGLTRELAYTGRNLLAEEAQRAGLVNRVFADKTTLLAEVLNLAQQIAEKSPLSTRGIKRNLLYARDHSVADSLEYIANWNAGMLLSNDLNAAFQAAMTKQKATFSD